MILERRILTVVPARGGSKGIPLKNLCSIAGIPLIGHTGRTLNNLPQIDRAVVSTDHDEIARVAEQYGIAAPFRRPTEISGDRNSDLEVLSHAILETERIDGVMYDIIVMLQPTSPIRRPEWVLECITKLVEENRDAVWTVSPCDKKFHPLKQLCLGTDGGLNYYDSSGSGVVARQDLGQLYFRNGVAYAFTRDCIINQKSITGRNAGAVVIKESTANIDTLEDLNRAEWLIQNPQAKPK